MRDRHRARKMRFLRASCATIMAVAVLIVLGEALGAPGFLIGIGSVAALWALMLTPRVFRGTARTLHIRKRLIITVLWLCFTGLFARSFIVSGLKHASSGEKGAAAARNEVIATLIVVLTCTLFSVVTHIRQLRSSRTR